jgi:hypothetical protein
MKPVIVAAAMIAVLHAAPARALRGVDPGASCSHAEEVEKQLGSTRRTTWLFAGRHQGEDASISYTCRAGTVAAQLITIEQAHEEQARATFGDLKRALEADLGPPSKDIDEPTIAELNESTPNLDLPVERFAVWQKPDSKRVVTLVLSGRESIWKLSILDLGDVRGREAN